jgi:hypothetical protein
MVDLSELTADQRIQQLAAILARGVRRYHQRLKRSESRPEQEVLEISANELDVRAEQSVIGLGVSGFNEKRGQP